MQGTTNWYVPRVIWFREDGSAYYADDRGELECQGYILGNDGHTLHLMSGKNFDGEDVFTMINLSMA